MSMQSLLDFDKNLLISLQGVIPNQYSLLVTIFAESIVLWCMIFLVGLWLYGVKKNDNSYKITSLQIFGLIASVFIIYSLVNIAVPQWRIHPSELLKWTNITPLIPHPTDNSFPSGHALFSGAFLVAVFYYFKKSWMITLTLFLVIITVCCRVLWGVHYPGDILAWLLVGIFGAIFFRPFAHAIINKISPLALRIASFLKL